MKKGFLFLYGLLLISSVNAYTYSGGLTDFLNRVDSSTVVLTTLFIVFFAFINFALTKFFGEENKSTAGIVAAAVSILLIYGINLSGLNFESLLVNTGSTLGLPIDWIYAALPIITILGFLIILIRTGLGAAFFSLGIFFIFSSFFVFERNLLLTIGGILTIIGFFMLLRKKDNSIRSESSEKINWGGGVNNIGRGTGRVIGDAYGLGKGAVKIGGKGIGATARFGGSTVKSGAGWGWNKTKSGLGAASRAGNWTKNKVADKWQAKQAEKEAQRKQAEAQRQQQAKEAHDRAMKEAAEEGNRREKANREAETQRKAQEQKERKLLEDKRSEEARSKEKRSTKRDALKREYNKLQRNKNPSEAEKARLRRIVEEIKRLGKS